MRLAIVIALAACGGRPAAAPPPPAPAPLDDPKCAGDLRPHRETMKLGELTELAAFGKQGIFKGAIHEHYDDGRYAMLLDLVIMDQTWLPDARDRGYHAFGDHCVRIANVTKDVVELDVAIQPAHAYDPGRCHLGCCTTEAQQKLGPNGEQECCFCDDDPTP